MFVVITNAGRRAESYVDSHLYAYGGKPVGNHKDQDYYVSNTILFTINMFNLQIGTSGISQISI